MVDALVALTISCIMATSALSSARSTLLTYQRNAAARHVLAQVRATQNFAVTRHAVFGLHWGGDPDITGDPAAYRIVRDTTGACAFPAADQAQDGTDVIADWFDLAREYRGVRIESIRDADGSLLGGVMFGSKGESVNTCTAVAYPIRVVVADADGNSRIIEVGAAGSTRLE